MLLDREQERRRLRNLSWAERSIRFCRHRHFIEDYIPGQVIYNLGEYPHRVEPEPTEYDFNQFKLMKEHGVGLIQLHEDWNDSIRVHGADKFSSWNPVGQKRFIDMAHAHGVKVIPYISSGYFQITDPDFRPDFVRNSSALRSLHFHYANCSPASAEWRVYLMDKLNRLLDEYPFDGLYNDAGYDGLGHIFEHPAAAEGDEGALSADLLLGINERVCKNFSPDMLTYDHEFADMLLQIANLVHERKGIYKVHFCMNFLPQIDQKFYDYYWVGEAISDVRYLKQCRDYPRYLVPCPDYYYTTPDEEAFFTMTIPHMQFPLGAGGRPVTGERALVPGIEYLPRELNAERDYYLKVNEWHKAHPDGPHVFGGQWYGTEGREGTQERWLRYLDLYRPMTKNGSWAYLEIGNADFICGKIPKDVVVSAYVNEKRYVVVANQGEGEKEIDLKGRFIDRQKGERVTSIKIPAMRMKMLEFCGEEWTEAT